MSKPSKLGLWQSLRRDGWNSPLATWLFRLSVAWLPVWIGSQWITSSFTKDLLDRLVPLPLLWMFGGLLLPFVVALVLVKGWSSLKSERRYVAVILATSISAFLVVAWFLISMISFVLTFKGVPVIPNIGRLPGF